jgi:hypothetical protein
VSPDSNKEATAKMRIFVVTLSGRTLTHEVEGSDTVEMLKDRIMDIDGIPANQQRLVFSGTNMFQPQTDGHSINMVCFDAIRKAAEW